MHVSVLDLARYMYLATDLMARRRQRASAWRLRAIKGLL